MGCVFLASAFLFLRQLSAFNDLEALFLTLLCALQPIVRVYSANVLSDIPFAAFALTALVLSNFYCDVARERCLRRLRDSRRPDDVCSGSGRASCGGDSSCHATAPGMRKATVFSAYVAPFFAALAWRALFSAPSQAPVALSTCSATWQGTWMAYTSYIGFWKIVSVHRGIFWPIQRTTLVLLCSRAATLGILFVGPSIPGTALTAVLSAIALMGVFRLARKTGWQPVHFSLVFYLVPLWFWPYPIADRGLLPFCLFFSPDFCPMGSAWPI